MAKALDPANFERIKSLNLYCLIWTDQICEMGLLWMVLNIDFYTRRCGLSSSSCGGLWPSAGAFLYYFGPNFFNLW